MTLGDVQISTEGSAMLARLTGEIDLSNVRGIEEAIVLATPNEAAGLVIDLGALDYLDSAGIQFLYRVREQLQVRGQSLTLVLPEGSPAADALRLAGVMAHLEISQTVEEALGAVSGETSEEVAGVGAAQSAGAGSVRAAGMGSGGAAGVPPREIG